MKILGLNIKKISGERKNLLKGKLEVKQNIDLKTVEKQELSTTKEGGLKIDFEFSLKYEPKVAEILIGGSVILLDEEDKGKELIKAFKKDKMDPKLKVFIYNYIIEKVSTKALNLEEELSIPVHLPFPKIKMQEAKEKGNPNYTG